MIIDVHGHFTSAPKKLSAYRAAQIIHQNRPAKGDPEITDEEIIECLKENLEQMEARHNRQSAVFPAGFGNGTPVWR